MKKASEIHLVDHGDDGLEDLALERAEDDALVLDGECDEARALPDEPLADVLHARDRHNEPVPPAARKPALGLSEPRGAGGRAEARATEPYLQVPSTSFMSLATSLSRRCGPKCRGCSCMFRSSTMWKNILASPPPPPRRPAAAAARESFRRVGNGYCC